MTRGLYIVRDEGCTFRVDCDTLAEAIREAEHRAEHAHGHYVLHVDRRMVSVTRAEAPNVRITTERR